MGELVNDDVRLAHHQVIVLLAAWLHRGAVTPASVARSVEKAQRFLDYGNAVLRAAQPEDPLIEHGMVKGVVPWPR